MLSVVSIFHPLTHSLMKLSKHKRLFISTLLFALLSLSLAKAYHDTNCLEVRQYQIKNSSLGEVLDGLKVAHLSDLHIKAKGTKENKRIKDQVREEREHIIKT